MMPAPAGKLIAWSRRLTRRLPWRETRDPYRIWVSEIMLQQTRVETAVPYYRRFLRKFPSVKAIAKSRLQSLLAVWEGLGYYSRARNLHRAAVKIRDERAGRFPRTAEEWEKMPGVGRYTAAAIACLAFDEPAVALDANARRILARVCAYRRTVRDGRAERDLALLFRNVRGASAPGVFFQGIMDLGQLVCLPRNPRCAECPVAGYCESRKLGIQDRLPIREKNAPLPHYDVTAAVILRAGKVLIARRPEEKLLGGLWEFPGGKRERGESLPACLRRELKEELGISARVSEKLLAVPHAFSHFRIILHVFRCSLLRGVPKPIGAAEIRWARIRDLDDYPMGKADRKVAAFLAGITIPD
jgi:A/G-specific adenine glycosylase